MVCVTKGGDQYFSEPVELLQGMAQGSILRPLLFLLYAKSLCDGFVSGLVCQYADDTSVVLADPSLGGLSEGCSGAAGRMRAWRRGNHLELNEEKTDWLKFFWQNQTE